MLTSELYLAIWIYVIKHVCLDTPTRAASHISTVDCHCHAYLVAGVVHNNVVSVIMDDIDKKINACHYSCQSSYISYKGDFSAL